MIGETAVRVLFLLSHLPNPRMCKRMQVLSSRYDLHVVYWDRCTRTSAPFSIPSGVVCNPITVRAPLGRMWHRLFPLLRFAKAAVSVAGSIKPDIIHCGGLDMLVVAWCFRYARGKRVRLVYEVADLPRVVFNRDNRPIAFALRKLIAAIEWYLLRSVSLLIVTSPHFWSRHYRGHILEDQVLFLPNAPARAQFASYEPKLHGPFTVGAIGSVRYPEQLKMLIRVAGSIPGVCVMIAGDGPSHDEIRDYCSDKPHVCFHGPYNYQKDIVDLYARVDCVYSVYDTSIDNVCVALPNRLYEAIVCQLPIIAAKGTELGHLVESAQIGFAVSDTDDQSLKDAINAMVTDPTQVDEIKKRLHNIRSDFYAEKGSRALLAKYEKFM